MLSQWIGREVLSILHGEIHVVVKVHDGRVAIIEKTKVEKEKPV